MKSNRSLSRFPLILLGLLVLGAMGFMAYLSTTTPVATPLQVEKEISLDALSDSMAKPADAAAATATQPAQLPVPASDAPANDQ